MPSAILPAREIGMESDLISCWRPEQAPGREYRSHGPKTQDFRKLKIKSSQRVRPGD